MIVVAVAVALLKPRWSRPPLVANPPASMPAATSWPTPDITTAPAPRVPVTYMDVVRAAYPRLAATQPMDPVETRQAGYILLDNPVYVCSRRDLWITHPLARSIEQVMKTAERDRDHILREQVVYVHWILQEARWLPLVVVRSRTPGRFDLVTADATRSPLPDRSYQWDAAFSWIKSIVVPTTDGVSLLESTPAGVTERFQPLPPAPSPQPVQVALDWRGVVAWRPAERAGQRAPAARYFDGRWSPAGDKWPAGLLHAWPLRGGSWLCFIHSSEAGHARIEIVVLDQADNHSGKLDVEIEKLIDQLGDDNSDARRRAFIDLANYGPAAFDTLEKHKNHPIPAVAGAIAQLLLARTSAAIQGMRPVDDRLAVLSRQVDGTSIFVLEGGLRMPDMDNADGDDESSIVAPAYLAMGYRPMPWIEVGSASFSSHVRPDFHRLGSHDGMWLAADSDEGLQRYIGNAFDPVLRRSRKNYTELVGIAHDGRWVLREKPRAEQGENIALGSSAKKQTALIVDPRLPDPHPRLPAWIVQTGEGTSGWSGDDFPAIRRGEKSAWAIMGEGRFKAIDETTGQSYHMRSDEMPAARPPTRPATAPATTPPLDRLLVEPDGTTWFDGALTLTVVRPDGNIIAWPLPELADGQSPATLMKTPDGLLFLANRPGRILRIRPRDAGDAGGDPFILEATFLKNIPADDVRRIWLDPAGRICIAHGDSGLTLLFPQGRIPPHITKLMLHTTAYDEDDESLP